MERGRRLGDRGDRPRRPPLLSRQPAGLPRRRRLLLPPGGAGAAAAAAWDRSMRPDRRGTAVRRAGTIGGSGRSGTAPPDAVAEDPVTEGPLAEGRGAQDAVVGVRRPNRPSTLMRPAPTTAKARVTAASVRTSS